MKKTSVKLMAVVVVVALLIGGAIGGTIAWLTDETDEIVNTFTIGNINIDLAETENDADGDNDELTNSYKMIPGQIITKDPKVTVAAGSEACWLFVKIEESGNFDDFMTYTIADGWTALDGVAGVYYREQVDLSAQGAVAATYSVLKNDQVVVSEDVTKGDMDSLTGQPLPTLTFSAYAVQKAGFNTAALAWAELNPNP